MKTTPAKFAVAVIVLRQNEEVEGGWEAVLVARKDDHTRWSLPGGKLDPPDPTPSNAVGVPWLRFAESSRAAAVRELSEETGIDCRESQLVEQETVLDSGGYLTTFYLLTANFEMPDKFKVAPGEAPVEWGPLYRLLEGPYGRENAERFKKMGILS